MLKKGDFILIILIVAVSVSMMAGFALSKTRYRDMKKVAVIIQNNNVIKKIDLDSVNEPERLIIEGDYREVILIEKGRIRFEEANCPDRLCVKTGWLNEAGDIAVCIPNGIIIKIEGEKQDVDGVTF